MLGFLARRRVPLGFVTAVVTRASRAADVDKLARRSGRCGNRRGHSNLGGWSSGEGTGGHALGAVSLDRASAVRRLVSDGAGVVIAAHSVVVGVLAAVYMVATMTAAVRTEEAFLRGRFGGAYDEYRRSEGEEMDRRFSAARAWRNKEYRAVVGLLLASPFLP